LNHFLSPMPSFDIFIKSKANTLGAGSSGLKKEERPSFRGLPPPAIIYHPFGIKKEMTGENYPVADAPGFF